MLLVLVVVINSLSLTLFGIATVTAFSLGVFPTIEQLRSASIIYPFAVAVVLAGLGIVLLHLYVEGGDNDIAD